MDRQGATIDTLAIAVRTLNVQGWARVERRRENLGSGSSPELEEIPQSHLFLLLRLPHTVFIPGVLHLKPKL